MGHYDAQILKTLQSSFSLVEEVRRNKPSRPRQNQIPEVGDLHVALADTMAGSVVSVKVAHLILGKTLELVALLPLAP